MVGLSLLFACGIQGVHRLLILPVRAAPAVFGLVELLSEHGAFALLVWSFSYMVFLPCTELGIPSVFITVRHPKSTGMEHPTNVKMIFIQASSRKHRQRLRRLPAWSSFLPA